MEPKSYEITIDGKLKVSLITLMILKTVIDSNEQLFGCNYKSCGKWFTTREAFVSHITTHEMSDEMTGAAAVDTTMASLSDTNTNRYMCGKCLKSFETHQQLSDHRTRAHVLPLESDPPVIPINDNTRHQFTCCDQLFETLSEYHKHLDEIHRKYRCIVCDQRFIAEVLLTEHRYNCPPTTTSQHPFIQCLLKACGQLFQTFDELKRHLKEMHYKYNCNKCENSFASPELLLTHKMHCLLNKSVDTHHGSQDLNVSTDSLPKQIIDMNSVEMTVDGSHKTQTSESTVDVIDLTDDNEDAVITQESINQTIAGITVRVLFTCTHPSCGQSFVTLADYALHINTHIITTDMTAAPVDTSVALVRNDNSISIQGSESDSTTHAVVLDTSKQFVNSSIVSPIETNSFQMKCLTDNCGQEFTDKSTAIKHVVNDHQIYTIYECDGWRCGQLFVMSDAFVEHCLRVHKLKIAINDGVWTQKSRLLVERHIDKSLGIKPYVCTHEGCGKRFPIYQYLKSHVKISHSTIRPFVCDYKECGLSFKLRKTLQTHKYQVHECVGQPKIKCTEPGCGRAFKSDLSLRAHIKRLHSGREYRCDWPDCDYRGRHEQPFRDHVRRHTNDKPFACRAPGCEYRAHSKTVLWYHNRNKHMTHKPFACNWPACEYTCKYKTLLRQHASTHVGGDKPYACDWPACDYKCRYKPNIYLHQRSIHRTGKTYECDWPACQYNTYSKTYLSLHRSTHTTSKPYSCHWPGCDRTFKNSLSVRSHLVVHTAPAIPCDVNGCQFKTKYQKCLISHKKSIHKL